MANEIKVALIGGIFLIISAIIGIFSININIEKNKLDENVMTLKLENDTLKANIKDLKNQLSQYTSLKEENESLKDKISNLELKNQELAEKYNNLMKNPLSSQKQDLISGAEIKNTSIREITEFYSDGINHRNNRIMDNIGNSYDGYTFMSAGDMFVELKGSVVYRNNNQYTRLFGRVIIENSEKDIEECGYVKIYGNDMLLFDSGIMGRGIEPVDFDLNITDYKSYKSV